MEGDSIYIYIGAGRESNVPPGTASGARLLSSVSFQLGKRCLRIPYVIP